MSTKPNTENSKTQKTITQFFRKQNPKENDSQQMDDTKHFVNTKGSKLSLKRKRIASDTNLKKRPVIVNLSDEEDFEPLYTKKEIPCTSEEKGIIKNNNSFIESVCEEWSSPVKENHSQNSNKTVNTDILEPEVILTEDLTIAEATNDGDSLLSMPESIRSWGLVSPTRTPTPSPIKSSTVSPKMTPWISPLVKSPSQKSPLGVRSVSKRAQNTALFNSSPGPSVNRQIGSLLTSPEKERNLAPAQKENFRSDKGMYLENFLHIIEFVQSNEEDCKLFNEHDLQKVEDFLRLSLEAKKLYVRLFQRQVKWNKYSKIEYKDICDTQDMVIYLNELVYAGLLFSEDSLIDVSEALNLLDLKDLGNLARDYKIKKSTNKDDIISNLLKIGTEQRTIASMFKKKNAGTNQLISRVKDIVGHCFIMNRVARDIFMRFLVLYSLPNFGEEDNDGQQSQLTTLLLIKLGKLKYPSYEVLRNHSLFRSRDDLINFVEYHQLECDARERIVEKKWDELLSICAIAKDKLDSLTSNSEVMSYEAALPNFLRRYTTVSILFYIWSYSVEAYQRLAKYDKAVEVLKELLSQKTHLQDSRGRWTDRLALNLEKHLKSPLKALETIQIGLCDPEIMAGHQLALSQRAERIIGSKKSKTFADSFKGKLKLIPIKTTPKIVIQGECVLHDSNLGRRLYVSKSPSKDLVSSVEEYVLSYYRSIGFSEGLHHEAAVIHVLFGLLFWNCIYHPVSDVFRSPHQAVPLDLDSPYFYKARKEIFDKRMEQLLKASIQDIQNDINDVWCNHVDEISIVNWTIFRDCRHVKSLIPCLGASTIVAICKRLIQNHRFTRSGFPDLIVWDPADNKCSIVEVKGPNDKLSTKQILWIEYLNENGADAKVCHVEAISSKKYWD